MSLMKAEENRVEQNSSTDKSKQAWKPTHVKKLAFRSHKQKPEEEDKLISQDRK